MTARARTPRERTWSATAADAVSTVELGRILGEAAPDSAVILLEGPLGAGKTTLAQGVALGCGVQEPVTSPTYNLVLHYRGRRLFTHVDLYRLAEPADLTTLDVDEIAAADGVTCIEWPGLVRGEVAPPYAEIVIERVVATSGLEHRRLSGRFVGSGWSPALEALSSAGAEVT